MYKRRKSSAVLVGNIPMGGENPIRIQSMTNTSTLDTEKSIQQCIQIIEAGGEYIRLAARNIREAKNLKNIKNGLIALGYKNPLIADIHFNHKIAETAAKIVDKVRINPGNFVNSTKTLRTLEKYQQGLRNIKKHFIPFLNICKENNTAIRIGVNQGSLSDRIINRYGNSPQGMVESCMEFLRICITENFLDVVISIKTSNIFLMVQTIHLLIKRMNKEGMNFPLHLGVTEAGEGEDGRIKSAIGIGTLLTEGIGDTIRISLSENPESEISFAHLLINYVEEKKSLLNEKIFFPLPIKKRSSNKIYAIVDRSNTDNFSVNANLMPDFIYIGKQTVQNIPYEIPVIVDFSVFLSQKNTFPLFKFQEKEAWINSKDSLQFIILRYSELTDEILFHLKNKLQTIIIIYSIQNNIYEQRAFIYALVNKGINNSFILQVSYDENHLESLQVKSSIDCGPFLLNKLIEGILIKNKNKSILPQSVDDCTFSILQATSRKITKTEYIACPGCGRTLFDLQTTLKKVKLVTPHLKGMKIAVMGCIVNGIGEVADADYGYVGAGVGKVNLYKGKKCIRKNIPEEKAADEFLRVINFSIKNNK
ncbi:MAG: 4-hydroxy-3-methylbut-2-en-1-yl diphosphate synthase [Candidatus Azobacteroides pseudotrichonymphae]|jgi:(E)-4-hydroxy-3-methylbut-2-enyl-diphosphate synthase|nr:(E)-4-hydroxy-3-methylbut-2-enyl-diphosphate synthase [Bacteroidales bacterium OttesenSCG-928-I14]GMO32286.1 MAG: 4-hydroxy-3-methylbut-2-en-1-yl diphosphate synthase [Candidatus Azobacteroides pseudotrichonymphae]